MLGAIPSGIVCLSNSRTDRIAGRSACVSTPACGSWTATATTESSESPSATPTPVVHVNIYANSGCTKLLDKIELNAIGQCYKPQDSDGKPRHFKCFKVVDASPFAIGQTEIIAFKGAGCFSADDSDREVYPDIAAIGDNEEKPFKMGSLSLNAAGT